jgi:hypothetical protein
MLSKVLKRKHDLATNDGNFLYFFEEGSISEHDIARELVPLIKTFDAKGNGKIIMLPDINELSDAVPEILVKPVSAGEGSEIAGINIPKVIHEEVASGLADLGYTIE